MTTVAGRGLDFNVPHSNPTARTTPEQRDRAMRHVASSALDADDARQLLTMLDLMPEGTR